MKKLFALILVVATLFALTACGGEKPAETAPKQTEEKKTEAPVNTEPAAPVFPEGTVSGKTYYTVNGNDIIACFDDNIDNDVIVAIAKQNPLYAVFKDKSFATDSVGINNEQLFKTYSPSTVVKVI